MYVFIYLCFNVSPIIGPYQLKLWEGVIFAFFIGLSAQFL